MKIHSAVTAKRFVRHILPLLVLAPLVAVAASAAETTAQDNPPAAAADVGQPPEGTPLATNTELGESVVDDPDNSDGKNLFDTLEDSDTASESARYKYSVRYIDGNRRQLETVRAASEPLAYRKVRKKYPEADSILLVEVRRDGERVDRSRREEGSGRTISGPLSGGQDSQNRRDVFLAAEMRRQRIAERDRAAKQEWNQELLFADDAKRRSMINRMKATQLAALRGLAAVPTKMRSAVLSMLNRFKYTIIPGTGKTGGQIKEEILRRGGSLIPKDPVSSFTDMMDQMHQQNIQNILRGKTFQDINLRMQQAVIELQQRRQAAQRLRQQASTASSRGSRSSGAKTTFSKGNKHTKKKIGDRVKSGGKGGKGGTKGKKGGGTGGGVAKPANGGGGDSDIKLGSGIPVNPNF